jgi:excisionase family DNA binding protein
VLSVKQVAERLGLCKMTVYRLIHAGKIPAVQVGKSYRIEQADLMAYLRRSKTRGKINPSGAAGGQKA